MSLPLELYQPIIQNVEAISDLYKLLFVSRAVSHEAERVLYHTIHIAGTPNPIPRELLLHLSRCARVARYVRELAIWGSLLMDSPPATESGIQEGHVQYSARFLNQTLRALTNLRVLILKIWIWQEPHVQGRIPGIPLSSGTFSGCSFKLEVLKLDNYSANGFPDIDLTQIKELSLHSIYLEDPSRLQSHPNTFPSLQFLKIDPSLFHTFNTHVIGRIKALHLCGLTRSVHFGGTFANVTSLKIYWRPDILPPFPSVRYLYTFQDLYHLQINRAYVQALSTFKHLEKLCLAISQPLSQLPPDIHLKIFSAIDSLKELILVRTFMVENLHGDKEVEDGELWRRDGAEPINVSGACIVDEWKDSRWF